MSKVRGLRGRAKAEATEPKREPLSRERILEAALAIMDAEGLEAVTMRRIGRELGVEAMSLYNHVHDKDDILAGITDLVMGEFDLAPSRGDWREDAKEAARAWRRMLARHPSVITLLVGRRKPLGSPQALRPMDAALEVLRRAGLDVRDSVQAFHAFGGYIMGFVLMEQGLLPGREAGDHLLEHEDLAAALVDGPLPHLAEALPVMHECPSEEQFEFGLELMVQGLERRLRGA